MAKDVKTAAEPNAAEKPAGRASAIWPVAAGLATTAAFYLALPYLPVQRDMAERYFAGHWIEYCETGLFFIGVALIVAKALRLGRERAAIDAAEASARAEARSEAAPATLYARLPGPLRGTAIGDRLRDAADFAAAPSAAGQLGEHLKYLAELAADRLHGSYGLIRTICWAIPILGFLGTVMGITMAIANIDPGQLNDSIGAVTSELAIAFDTTAVALGFSLVLVFGSFAVERSEQGVFGRVEAFAMKRLATAAPPASPLAQAESKAAAELIDRTGELIRAQTELWQDAIESMRRKWGETVVEQQGRLGDALSEGMRATLADHAEGLKEARRELVAAVAGCAERLDRSLTNSDAERARQFATFSQDLSGLWDRCRGDLDAMQDRYRQTLGDAVANVGGELAGWREEIRRASETAATHQAEMARQSELLAEISERSADLGKLEGRLTENLESLRSTETFQEAVHSLTAAAHLLTARSRNRFAA